MSFNVCSLDESRTVKSCILFSLVTLFFLMSTSVSIAASFKHKATGLVLPQKLAFFTRGDTIDLERNYPGHGMGILYKLSDINAMVQIYDLTRKSRKVTAADLLEQTKVAKADVLKKVETRHYDRVDLLMEPSIYLKNNGGAVYATGFTVFVEGRSFREYVYLTYYRRHFIKIRVTHPGSSSDDIVRNSFVREFIRFLDNSSRRDRYTF